MTDAAGSFDIVRYRPEHKTGVARLWRQAFDSTIRERRAYFEWKYEQNPYFREPILVVALDARGRVVGTRGFLGSCWQTPTGVIPIPCAEDFAIAPRHRDTGLATAIMRFALDDLEQRGFEYVMNASGGQVTVLNSLAMGWKTLGPMQPVARMTTQTPRVRSAEHAVLSRARRLFRGRPPRTIYRRLRRQKGLSFSQLDQAEGPLLNDPEATISVSGSPDPASLAALAARIPADGRIRHVRGAEYFEWRLHNPTREYRSLLYRRGGHTEGYMLLGRLRTYHPPGLPFRMLDWDGTSEDVRAALLEFALTRGGVDGLDTWAASLSNESKALLARSGFEPAQPELRARGLPCVLLKRLGKAAEWELGGAPAVAPSRWDIRLMDSMTA